MLSGRINSGAAKIRLDGLESQGGQRLDELLEWLKTIGPADECSLQPASSDASFRRYFRLVYSAGTLIVMDAPPEREDMHSFIEVDRLFGGVGVRVPEIVEYDLNRGFMLLEDFGSTSYLSTLDTETAAELYANAMQVLRLFNNDLDPGHSRLPRYDDNLVQREMDLFEEWFLAGKLGIRLTEEQVELLQSAKAFLTQVMLEQPRVVVHRDFHSRNLMLVDGLNPGVLDFQDAVVGPLTYDLVSLLRDCYIAWPEAVVVQWVRDYFDGLNLDGVD
ncbi:MAG: phosphotransferase, partial [Pseudomonadota bacterium]|nr:phosphotransferase [Pseudomonadota bacterium]